MRGLDIGKEKYERDACLDLVAAVIKRAVDDLDEKQWQEVLVSKDKDTGKLKRVVKDRKEWKSAVEFMTGSGLDTWLEAANIDAESVKGQLRKDGILGDVSMGLGLAGLMKINRAQHLGWLYGC